MWEMTPLEKRRRRVPNAKCQCQHPSSSSFVGAGGRKEKGRLSKFEQNEHSRFPPQPIPLLACSSTFLLIPFVRYSVVSGEEDGGDGSYGRQSQSQNEEEEEKRRREKINMTDRTGKGKKVFASCITTQTERKCEPFLPLFFFFFSPPPRPKTRFDCKKRRRGLFTSLLFLQVRAAKKGLVG